MVRRTVTAVLLLALVLPAVFFGGYLYLFYVGGFIGVSAWEYVRLFRLVKFQPSLILTVAGTLLIVLVRGLWPAYAEWYITPTYWPDFDKEEYRRALATFGQRDRRYGGVSEAVANKSHG